MNKSELIKLLKIMCDAEEIRFRSLEIESSVDKQLHSCPQLHFSGESANGPTDEQIARTVRLNEYNKELHSKIIPLRSYINERLERINDARNDIFNKLETVPNEYKFYGPMSVFLGYLQLGICSTLEDCISKYNYDKANNMVYAEHLYDDYDEDETNKFVPDTILAFRNSIRKMNEQISGYEKGVSDSKTFAAQTGTYDFQRFADYGNFLIELIEKEIENICTVINNYYDMLQGWVESYPTNPAPSQPPYPPQVTTSGKSKTVAGILAILLGSVGAHKFYMGKYGMGILYLLFCTTYIPAIIGIVEGIMYLTESEEKFESRID